MTKEKIKSAALALFAKNGFAGTTLAEIAQEVGIKTPSIFSHFKGKEELFLVIFREVNWQIVEHVKQLDHDLGQASVEEKLHSIFTKNCRFYLEDEARSIFLKRTMLFPPEFLQEAIVDGFLHSEDALSAILTKIFQQGIESGELRNDRVEKMLAAYYCMIDGILIQIHIYGKEQMEARIACIWEHFWLGLKNHGAIRD